MSLYAMDDGGSVPEPLLPPHIALQNPHLMGGYLYYVFPKLGQILVMIDNDGDENYQPYLIPIEGGFPQLAFGDALAGYRCHVGECDEDRNIIYVSGESRHEPLNVAFQGHLETGELIKLAESKWGGYIGAANEAHRDAIVLDAYTIGDHVLYRWQAERGEPELLYGTPLEARAEGQVVKPNAIFSLEYTPSQKGLIFVTALFSDTMSLGYLDLSDPGEVKPVKLSGEVHEGVGEMEFLEHLAGNRFLVGYNIDGCSWLYEGVFDEADLALELQHVICGRGELANGVREAHFYDKETNRFVLSFSTATSPTQIYSVEGKDRNVVRRHTNERLLGIPEEWLSAGEDASYTSFDCMRVSARLYLPSPALGFEGKRPLIYYVHGGPQGQERPDFTWFSMPLIQFLTLNGFAVFVPNVRGSTGYGLSYTKEVDRDWGGDDRLDHVHAMTQVLPQDERLDITRTGVAGRSYGGYMTLTLAARHPELWSAAVDMFGPYDLLTFMERIPETWKPYFAIAVGDPEKDRDFLVERSPRTYIEQIACPLLVIQGKNDPRVIERESRDVVEQLRAIGKEVEYLMFEDEGHDVLKHENRVRCYNAITDFFKQHLMDE